MSRPKGKLTTIGAWVTRTPADQCKREGAEFQLNTRGMNVELVARWDAMFRDMPDDLAAEVLDAAQGHCDLVQNDTSYSICLAVPHDGGLRVISTLPIKCKSREQSTHDEGSPQGFVTQVMRHNNDSMKIWLRSQEATMAQSMRLTEVAVALATASANRVAELEIERRELLEVEADAVRAAGIDEVAAKREEMRDRRAQKFEMLLEEIARKAFTSDAGGGK